MKKLLMIGICILGLLVVATSAKALNLPADYMTIKYTSYSIQETATPTGPNSKAWELWGISHIANIYETGNPTNIYWQPSANEELTAIAYNMKLVQDYTNGLTQAGSIYYSHYSGTQLATLDLWDDLAPLSTYDASGGPTARTSVNTYPTVTDDTLYLSSNYMGIIDDPLTGAVEGYVYKIDVTFDPVSGLPVGNTLGYLSVDLTTGVNPGLWDWNNPLWAGADLQQRCDIEGTAFAGWETYGENPVKGYVVPEPATMLLLGSGLLGLAGFGRKRKKTTP